MKKERLNGKIIIQISIVWVFVLAIALMSILSFFKSTIFATNNDEVKQEEIFDVEENENVLDILSVMVENNYENKKIVNEKRNIPFEIEKIQDDQIAKGEEEITTKGSLGEEQITALQQFDNGKYISEEILEIKKIKEPVKQIVHVGTSEFLAKQKVKIGEDMFLLEKSDLKKEAKEDSEIVTTINRYLNFKVLQVSKDWTKVKYQEMEGYLPNNIITSEKVTPIIKEQNRIALLKENLKIDMDLSKPSGLTLNDFKTVLGYNLSDKNLIFSKNVEAFYNAEQKYQINGIFIAAIGIHESAWGTSFLAVNKNNLFGYKAYDRDPINSAQDFTTYEDAINTVAEALSKNYLTPTGSYYNGTTLEAVNKKYASDTAWFEKVFSYMEYLYDKLG